MIDTLFGLILAGVCVGVLIGYGLHQWHAARDRRRAAARVAEAERDCVITGHLAVPMLFAADDHMITADDLRAVNFLLAHQANTVAAIMHAAAMQAVIAQVARDEADQWPADLGGAA